MSDTGPSPGAQPSGPSSAATRAKPESIPAGKPESDEAASRPKFTTALIVDDAYDEITLENVPSGGSDFADAVAASEHEPELRAALTAFGCASTDKLTFPAGALEALYAADNLTPELKALSDQHLFRDIREKRAQVQALSTGLSGRGIRVLTTGSGNNLPTDVPDIVFLDYYLGAMNDADARAQAVRKLKDIEAIYSARLPFVVLMSSAVVDRSSQRAFRDESGWIAGLFDFSSKAELRRQSVLAGLVTLWEMLLPYRLQVHSFVHALNESLEQVCSKFMVLVRSLGVEDYAFLQRLHLGADGQPLGEYMLWLFGSALPHLAFDQNTAVSTTAARLDRLRFESLLPGNWEPSKAAAECYRLAISTPAVGAVAPHPLHEATPESKGLPYLQTGDLLTGQADAVWLVASPACDIAFAPGSERDNPNRYVVLLPGKLERLGPQTKSGGDSNVSTPLFERAGVPYRIRWRPTQPEYVKHGVFEKWKTETQVERTARLRLPYTLEVQQAFAQNLVRIGMPVPPPIPFNATLHIFMEGKEGLCESVHLQGECGARLFLLRDARRFHLNYDAIRSMVSALGTVKTNWQKRVGELVHQKAQEALNALIADLTKLHEDPAEWARLVREDFELPSGDKHTKIAGGLIQVYSEKTFSAQKFPAKDKAALVVSIIETLGIEVPEAETSSACSAATVKPTTQDTPH